MGIVKRDEFLQDFANAPDDVIDALNNDGGDLIEYWRQVDNLKGERLKIEYLRSFKLIRNSSKLNIEIFVGNLRKESTAVPNQFQWYAQGVHHKNALQVNNLGGKGRIKSGSSIDPIGPNNQGYYTAKVEIFDSNFPDNNGWKVKSKKSTFFPDQWSKEYLQEQLALAFKTKVYKYTRPDGTKFYKGTLSDGVECAIFVDKDGIITTMYPSFK